jgi:hypothetical protein
MNFAESALIQQCDENAVRQWSHSQGERAADLGPARDKSRASDQPQDCETLGLEMPPTLLAIATRAHRLLRCLRRPPFKTI